MTESLDLRTVLTLKCQVRTLNQHRIIAAVKNGELDEAVLDERVDNVVNLIMKSKPALEKEHTFDPKAHHAIAQKVAEGSMVF